MNRLIISRKNVTLFLVVVCFILIIHCFFLFPFPEFAEKIFERNICFGISIIAIFMYLITFKYKSIKFIDYFCFYILMAYFVLLFYSLMKYSNQDFKDIIIAASGILGFLIVRPIYIILTENKKCFLVLVFAYLLIGTIWNFIVVIQDAVYLHSSSIFLHQYFYDDQILISNRLDSLHIRIGLTFEYAPIIALSFLIISTKKVFGRYNSCVKLFLVIALLITIYSQIYINQSRMRLMIYCVSAILVLIFKIKQNWFRFLILVFLALVIPLLIRFNFISFNDIFSTNSSNLDYSTSNAAHYYEYELGINFFKENILFGHGLVSGKLYSQAYNVSGVQFYHSDCGIIGTLAVSGLIGAMLYVIPGIYFIIKMKRVYFKEYFCLYIGLLFSYLLHFISLQSITGNGCVELGFVFALLQFLVTKSGDQYGNDRCFYYFGKL